MSDKLSEIVAAKRQHVAAQRAVRSQDELERAASALPPPRGFAAALVAAGLAGRFALIAEIKRRSPSGGEIRPGEMEKIAERFRPDNLLEDRIDGAAD